MAKNMTLKRLQNGGHGSFYRLKGMKYDVTIQKIEAGFVYFSGKDLKGRERKSRLQVKEFCKSVDMDYELDNLPLQPEFELCG